MIRRIFFGGKTAVLAACCAIALAGCTATFLLSKDCKTYFFGSSEKGLYALLCASGDLTKVLSDTTLPPEMRGRLYTARCVDRSRQEVDALYRTLTPEEQSALKSSFVRHGYSINYKPVPNFVYDDYHDNINFCPVR